MARITRSSVRNTGLSLNQLRSIQTGAPARRQQPALPGARRRAFIAQYRIPPDNYHRHRLPDRQAKTVAVVTHRRRLPA